MSKNVVIIESPGKVKKFKEYLGKDYEILSSVGHCVDLPVKKIGVDVKNNFEPTWEVKEDSKSIIKEIKSACKKADNVYLMMDEDREGSGIAKHIYDQIYNICKGTIYRATTNQITKNSIEAAIKNAGTIEDDQNKINAYLTRRILDRLVGYRTSYLTQQSTGGRSAGRVQSSVLRIIVDRETEIINFKPVEYWILTAYLISNKGDKYTAVLTEKIEVPNEKTATKIYNACMKATPVIKLVESKEVETRPYAPFTTIPMVAEASNRFGWSASKTMKVAQDLYSTGLITYHRTDSPTMAPEAIQEIRGYVEHNYGPNYLPATANVYMSKKGAQEAHECCRPTKIESQNLGLTGDGKKLYELIWRRAIASQMTKAKDRRLRVITDIAKYDFVSNGRIQLFEGFRKVWIYSSSQDVILPDLKKGDEAVLKLLEKEQKFTQAPPRYSDASLAKFCEKKQITRPATVASVFKTLEDRKYVTKKKNTFYPTEIGIAVVNFLTKAEMCFVDIEFTAKLEEELDSIQCGDKTETEVLKKFWERLKLDIEKGKVIKDENQVTEFKCPKCGAFLLKKHSQFGAFFACQKSRKLTKKQQDAGEKPECDYLATVDGEGNPKEKVVKEKEYAPFNCKKCNEKMIKRVSKKGEFFYGCSNFSKSGCRCTASLDGVFSTPKAKKWGKKK